MVSAPFIAAELVLQPCPAILSSGHAT